MKKNHFLTVLLSISTMVMAFARDYNVTISNYTNDESGITYDFDLLVKTVETHSSMCGLQVTKIEITNPTSLIQNEILHVKDLKLEFALNPNAMCMMAFGPHRGAAQFQIGTSLPALSGTYNLIINGQDHGLLKVDRENGAVLEEPAQ